MRLNRFAITIRKTVKSCKNNIKTHKNVRKNGSFVTAVFCMVGYMRLFVGAFD